MCVVYVTGGKKERETERPLSTTTYNRKIEIFVCVVYVTGGKKERKKEKLRDHYLPQHIIGGLRF